MKKKILIINGHPYKESLNYAIADAYEKGALAKGAVVKRINIGELVFDLNLKFGYKKDMELEPDIKESIEKIKWADHVVFIYPLWWGSYPAIMKGFIDRVFLPKVAFDYDENNKRKMFFQDKSARIIVTMEQPVWYYKLICRSCATVQLKHITLNFCGIKKVRTTYFGSIGKMSEEKCKEILKITESIAQKEVRKLID
ncbi:MAG: NAD(P)H-dependent oxidoreductase [Campylobacteraceae bacterium]|jgi:putative NADPH-quinone reductase|nr:NAD(P)H-dependent oxidoreductase [Campylobacteraceae bacterium]